MITMSRNESRPNTKEDFDEEKEAYQREKELARKRKEWMILQEKKRKHELLKRQKIEEYERKRAEKLALIAKESTRNGRSRSRSQESQQRIHGQNKNIISEK